jgi:DNA polymerase III subunit delta
LLYVLWGEDEFTMEETLREIKSSLGDASLLFTNTNVMEGQKLSVKELKTVGGAMPFLSTKRLVIINGLVERFEPAYKSGQPQKAKDSGSKTGDSQLFADCIRSFPESTVLILMDKIQVRKASLQKNALFNAIGSQAEVKQFPSLKGTKLYQWIESRVNKGGGGISRQATNLLIEIVGGDLHTMSNEIDKLVAFTHGRLIEEKDIRMVVSASQEADIFRMIDCIMDRQAGIAEQILQKLLQNGVVPLQILVLLARQVQTIIQVKDLKSQKRPVTEIQTKVGIFSPFAWQKVSGRAEKYSFEKLKEIHQSLLKTDLAIKTGRFEGDLALNILVADLCEGKA